VRKLVLSIVVTLALVGAGIVGWKFWSDAQRVAQYAEWRQQLQDESRRDEIIAALREQLKVDASRSDARALLGEALVYAGKTSDAVVQLREAVKRDPENVRVHIMLGQVCLRLDLVDEAVKVLDEALAHADDVERPAVELVLGYAYQERYRGSAKDEDFRASRNYFQDARHHPATEAEAMDGYAMLWFTKGPNSDLDKGIATYRELLTKYPAYPRADKIREMLDTFDKAAAGSDAKPPDAKPPDAKQDEKGGNG
jgi:cytochrome c-type biogenesis protein CcmH/NrfG